MTKYAKYTQTQAAARAKAKVGKSNAVGMCAHEVIVNIFGIPGPWKWGGNGSAWAVNYFKGAQKVVKTSDPAKIPAGAMAFFDARAGATTNGGKAGHVAVGAGGGYIYSTDLPKSGKWGKVKITDVQRLWGKKLLGYVLVDGMGYTLTDKPKPKPKPKPVTPWFILGQWSLAGFDEVYGKAHFTSLEQGIVNEIDRLDCDVWGLTEVPEPQRATMAAKFEKVGLKLVVSDNGRTIVVKDHVRVGRTKIVTLKAKGPAKDDKQIVMAELFPSGPNAIILVVGHLEHRSGAAYDKTRVVQAKQEKHEGGLFADACDVPHDRLFFADDENSNAQVLDDVYHPTYRDVFEVAAKRSNADDATICGWDGKTSKGPRSDKVKVHKDRPIANATVSTSTAKKKLSDHVPNRVIVGKK